MNKSFAQLLPHLNFPYEVYFKKGSLIRLKFFDKDRVVIFTGKESLKRSGVLKKIQDYLQPSSEGLKFLSINSEPTFDHIKKISSQLLPLKPTLIIACGGGSVIDTAKIVKILLTNPQLNLLDYTKPHTLPQLKGMIKLIAVPTTSGSGAEASWAALIIDAKKKRKIPFVSSSLLPDIVILDPELTLFLRPNLTASTALDAFVHALESFCSTLSNNFSNHYARMAGTLIHNYLLKTLEDLDYLEGRENLQYAAFFAGIAQNSTSVGAIHALSHSLGGVTGIPHTLGNIIFLPAVLNMNCRNSSKPLTFLKETGFKSLESFLKWFDQVKKMSSLTSNWSKLSEVSLPSVDQIAHQAIDDVCMKTNIYQFSLKELIKILEAAR